MRAVVFTEELMGVALKFSRKSTNVGSLLVSWDSGQQQQQQENGKSAGLVSSNKQQKSFVRRVQATISLCLAIFLVTLLVFALCALESPSAASPAAAASPVQSLSGRRVGEQQQQQQPRAAMGGLGVVFRRGTKSMSEVVIAHVESDSAAELRSLALFIRTLHRSGVAARADLVLLFPGDARAMGERIVVDEDARFRKTIVAAANASASGSSNCTISRMNLAAYKRAAAAAAVAATGNVTAAAEAPLEVAWGAILGFDVAELDPTDTLSGFIDKPPMQLRRWVCYQMLLGIARHRYKAAIVAQVRGVLVLGDGLLGLARKSSRDGRSLVVVEEDRTWLDDGGGGSGGRRQRRRAGTIEAVYGKQVWASVERGDKAAWPMISAAVIAGGGRGVRAAAEAVATEIARAAMLRRSRSAFADSAALNYVLRRNAGALGQKVADRVNAVGRSTGGAAAVNVVRTAPSIRVFQQEGTADNYAVVVSGSNSSSPLERYLVDDLCSSPVESSIYDADCGISSSRAAL